MKYLMRGKGRRGEGGGRRPMRSVGTCVCRRFLDGCRRLSIRRRRRLALRPGGVRRCRRFPDGRCRRVARCVRFLLAAAASVALRRSSSLFVRVAASVAFRHKVTHFVWIFRHAVVADCRVSPDSFAASPAAPLVAPSVGGASPSAISCLIVKREGVSKCVRRP